MTPDLRPLPGLPPWQARLDAVLIALGVTRERRIETIVSVQAALADSGESLRPADFMEKALLPRRDFHSMWVAPWGRHGDHTNCDGCERRITRAEISGALWIKAVDRLSWFCPVCARSDRRMVAATMNYMRLYVVQGTDAKA